VLEIFALSDLAFLIALVITAIAALEITIVGYFDFLTTEHAVAIVVIRDHVCLVWQWEILVIPVIDAIGIIAPPLPITCISHFDTAISTFHSLFSVS
jgi:hypothetical protein